MFFILVYHYFCNENCSKFTRISLYYRNRIKKNLGYHDIFATFCAMQFVIFFPKKGQYLTFLAINKFSRHERSSFRADSSRYRLSRSPRWDEIKNEWV